MHKLEVYVVDFEDYGSECYVVDIEQIDCGLIMVKSEETVDIGEWDDDHPFNCTNTPVEAFRKAFEK